MSAMCVDLWVGRLGATLLVLISGWGRLGQHYFHLSEICCLDRSGQHCLICWWSRFGQCHMRSSVGWIKATLHELLCWSDGLPVVIC